MNKDELRAFLAQAVPAAMAEGRLHRFNRVGAGKAGKVSGKTNTKIVPEYREPRPRRIHQRQGTKGAGFEVETYKPFALTGTASFIPAHMHEPPSAPKPYRCTQCGELGNNCTC